MSEYKSYLAKVELKDPFSASRKKNLVYQFDSKVFFIDTYRITYSLDVELL